jgi:hypothetical protein
MPNAQGYVKAGACLSAVLTEHGSLNPAMCGQAAGAISLAGAKIVRVRVIVIEEDV